MAGLDLVTAPTSEPLSVADAKAHLNVDFADDDAKIGNYISAARAAAEVVLKMSLLYSPRNHTVIIAPLTCRRTSAYVLDKSSHVPSLPPALQAGAAGRVAMP